MNIKDQEIQELDESQQDFDMEAATADISSDLFGQEGESEESSSEKGGEKSAAEGEGELSKAEQSETGSPPDKVEKTAEELAAETSAEVRETGAPKTWTKEGLAEWATISPRAQQEILKREEDFLKGITQYKTAADVGQRYDAVVEPYRAMLTAENIDPVGLFQSFSANHYLLSRGTPEQKTQLAANLLTGYNIDLAALLNHMADEGTVEAPSAEVQELRRELNEIKGHFTSTQQRDQAATQTRISSEIDAFAADPKNIYFEELSNDIQQIFEKGMATTLSEAYEKALWSNSVTRQKETDRLTADRQSSADTEARIRADKRANSQGDHVNLKPKQKDGTIPTGSIDDTLAETMAKIESRG